MKKGTMKAWQLSRFAFEALGMAELPIPKPGANQILLKVNAVSLNYRDIFAVEGRFGTDYPLPFIPASDAAGTVVATGSNVQRFRTGDRVISTVAPTWLRGKIRTGDQWATLGIPLPGVLAEYVLLNEQGAVTTPEYLSDVEASTLPVAAVTAWSALFERCLIGRTGGKLR